MFALALLTLVVGPWGAQDGLDALGYAEYVPLIDDQTPAVSVVHAPAKVVIGQPV